jgi:hypothetical protein
MFPVTVKMEGKMFMGRDENEEGDGRGYGSADREQVGRIQRLDREYSCLQQKLNTLEVSAKTQFNTDTWTSQAELTWLAEVDPLRDRMFAIAMELATLTVVTEQDLRTKAKVLMDFSNGETGDVVHLLATALCSDILRINWH